MMQVKQISDNEIYLLIKYIKSVFWGVAKRLSYIEDARCLTVNVARLNTHLVGSVHCCYVFLNLTQNPDFMKL